MTKLENYLRSIRPLLPSGQREDIIRELSANFQSQLDDREADLGRPLTDAEQEEIFQQHGSPVDVAGSYQPDQRRFVFGRQIVGPALFPLYQKILCINVGLTLIVSVIVVYSLHGPWAIFESISTILTHLAIQFSIVTLIFALVELGLKKSPRTSTEPAIDRVSRFDSFAELVALSVFLSWLLSVWNVPQLLVDPNSPEVRFGPVWQQVYWPIVIATSLDLLTAAIMLFLPTWTRFHSWASVGVDALALGILFYLLKTGDYLIVANPAADGSGEIARKVGLVNLYLFFYSLLATAIIIGVHFLWHVRKLVQGRTARKAVLAV